MSWESTRNLARTLACNGEMVRFFRHQRGWTQQQLADVAGYTERLVRKAETGRKVNADTIEDLAVALSMPGCAIHPEDLISDPRSALWQLIEGFARHELQMAHHGAPAFAQDVEFVVPGDPNQIPFAGRFRGVDGLDEHARLFFGMFERTQKSLFLGAKIVVEGKRVGVFSRDVVRMHKHLPELSTPVNYAAVVDRGKISYLESFYDSQATFEFIRRTGERGSGCLT